MANLQGHARKKWRAGGYFVEAGEHVSRLGYVQQGEHGPRPIVRRHDTFGFADLLCVKGAYETDFGHCRIDGELVLLQVTSWSNVSARVNKIARESHGLGQHARPMIEIAKMLLSIPGVRIVVEGWKLNKTTNRWESREVEVTPEVLDERRERVK